MNGQNIEEIVNEVIARMTLSTEIPIGVSARHCHLDKESMEILFGKGYKLTNKANLSQPNQFAANETVIIAGPRGSIANVRILGPLRPTTQIEISQTDAFKLGLNPPIRLSGNTKGSSSVTVIGPKGSIYLQEGLIIAQAHIHMNPGDAEKFSVDNGDFVAVKIDNGQRAIQFSKTLIRVSENYHLEMHIDTDEANALDLGPNSTIKIIK